MRLEGKVAVITGGAKGIGGAIATGFCREGAALVIPDMDGEALATKQREIELVGRTILPLELDISRPENATWLISETVARFGKLDILVNNAVWASYGPFLEMRLEDWRKTLDLALTSYFLCAHAAAHQMRAQNRGKIINIASIAGQVGIVRSAPYSASKGGILALTRVMAIELAPFNIQVNNINPGFIMTKLAQKVLSEEDQRAREAVIPAGRYGVPEDLIGAALFLASDESDYVTGTSIVVDGGVTCGRVLQ